MAVVAAGSGGQAAKRTAAGPTSSSEWSAEKHLAYSDVAHLRVDSVRFALRLRANSTNQAATESLIGPSTEDPATRGRRNRDAERRKRNNAKRKVAAAAAAAAASTRGVQGDSSMEDDLLADEIPIEGSCTNKPCVRRNAMEDKLLSRLVQIKTELERKVLGVHKLKRTVVEKERGRDVAVEEIAALKDATEAAATGAEERRKRLQTAEEERRRLSGELERLELELRKLRKRDEEETQQNIPLPRGSMITEGGDAWMTSEGEPFVSDGLAVVFRGRNGRHRRKSGPEPDARLATTVATTITGGKGGSGSGGGGGNECDDHRNRRAPAWQPFSSFDGDPDREEETESWGCLRPAGTSLSKRHSGRFGRWGADVHEQWSCCLWESQTLTGTSGDPGSRGGAGGRRGGDGSTGDRAEGCERVRQRGSPGGMTTADDVRLKWRRHQTNPDGFGSISGGGVVEAWGERDLARAGIASSRDPWKPRISGSGFAGRSAGAAWSLVRARPKTAHAKTKTAAFFSAPPHAAHPGRGGGGSRRADSRGIMGRDSGERSRPLVGSSRPGSAPPRVANDDHHQLKQVSSLSVLRNTRSKAGWQRLRVGDGGRVAGTAKKTRSVPSGRKEGLEGSGGWAWQSTQSGSIRAGAGLVSVYSRREEPGNMKKSSAAGQRAGQRS